MNDADKYRANARYCLDKADQAQRLSDREAWLLMAQTWLGMIPERQRAFSDTFDVTARYLGTGQEPSTSEH